jgi:FMN phosphatase YigB (HAD superfamily)
MEMYGRAGLDSELATALYEAEWDPANRPPYPDVLDALASLANGGARVAIVSDIHFDIRAESASTIGRYVDAYVLSCEQLSTPQLRQTVIVAAYGWRDPGREGRTRPVA